MIVACSNERRDLRIFFVTNFSHVPPNPFHQFKPHSHTKSISQQKRLLKQNYYWISFQFFIDGTRSLPPLVLHRHEEQPNTSAELPEECMTKRDDEDEDKIFDCEGCWVRFDFVFCVCFFFPLRKQFMRSHSSSILLWSPAGVESLPHIHSNLKTQQWRRVKQGEHWIQGIGVKKR